MVGISDRRVLSVSERWGWVVSFSVKQVCGWVGGGWRAGFGVAEVLALSPRSRRNKQESVCISNVCNPWLVVG